MKHIVVYLVLGKASDGRYLMQKRFESENQALLFVRNYRNSDIKYFEIYTEETTLIKTIENDF